MSSSFLSLPPSAIAVNAPENTSPSATSYSSAFPPLHSIPLTNSHNKNKAWGTLYPPKPSLLPPKYPAYLKNTNYSRLADEQYHQQCRIKKASRPIGAISSLFNKSEPSVQYDSALEELDLRLPCHWNPIDKNSSVTVSADGMDISYSGLGRDETDASSVRSAFSAKSQCGVFYYEIEIVSKGRDGYISIGYCEEETPLERLSGLDSTSYGYHANDGKCYHGSNIGAAYGPSFTTGDVIGCGINFGANTLFYTKNGVYLGTAFNNIKIDTPLYPCVGLRTPGEHIRANFGTMTFQFDIVQFMNEESSRLQASISNTSITPTATKSHNSSILTAAWMKQVGKQAVEPATPPKSSQQIAATSEILDQLVHSFLLHHGYSQTAELLYKNVKETKNIDLAPEVSELAQNNISNGFQQKDELIHRQDIRSAVIAGDIDAAINLTQAYFPQVLSTDELLLFRLRKRKFIEMLRATHENSSHTVCDSGFIQNFHTLSTTFEEKESTHPHDMGMDKVPTVFGTPRKLSSPAPISPAPASDIPQPGRRVSYASITATPTSVSPPHSAHGYFGRSFDDGNSVEEPGSPTSYFHVRRRRRSSSHMSYTSLSSFEEDDEEKPELREAFRFGHLLQEQYGRDQRPAVKAGIAEIMCLLSEADSYNAFHLASKAFDVSGRDVLAGDLNTAILGNLFDTFLFVRYD
ncbi:unnamed protein product [Umbelopsis sp. WA50703]